MKAVHWARDSFVRVGAYHWLYSIIEESIFNHSKFAPEEYCIDNISDISSKDNITAFTETCNKAQLEEGIKDENNVSPLHYVTAVRKSTTEQNNFNDTRQNRITETSIFNNLLTQRIRNTSYNVHDKLSLLELNARESTLVTLVEQSSPCPTSRHDLDYSFLAQTIIKNEDVVNKDSKGSNNYSCENEWLETTGPSRHSDGNGHFLAVHSALSVVARRSVEWSNDYLTECPSQLFMQHFIAPGFQPKKSTSDIDNNNSNDNFGKKSIISSIKEENIILEIPKKISFGKNVLNFMKESDEEREIDSVKSKISV